MSAEFKTSEFSSRGLEAFTPPSQTDVLALALVEEKHLGAALWQLGARIENVRLRADPATAAPVQHAHEEEEPAIETTGLIFEDYDFNPYSMSAGLVWDITEGYKFGISYSHAQRAPSAAELFALGPHIGTRSFEAGALFEVHAPFEAHEETPGEFHLDYVGGPEKENSNNLDVSLRKHQGNLGFVLNGFYNEIADYYYQAATGLTTHDLFHEAPEDEHGHNEELPVFIFRQADAIFYGVELELVWRPADYFAWTLWGDSIHGELKSGEYLPRTPPKRLGVEWNLKHEAWDFRLGGTHHFEQDHIAAYETATDSYSLLEAEITYTREFNDTELTLFLQGDNLTDEEARVHSSFLKDQAPLPGRGLRLGMRGVL